MVNLTYTRRYNQQERLRLQEEEADDARALLEAAREEAVAEARGAEGAAAEARELRAALEETRKAVADKENKARGAEMAVKVQTQVLRVLYMKHTTVYFVS